MPQVVKRPVAQSRGMADFAAQAVGRLAKQPAKWLQVTSMRGRVALNVRSVFHYERMEIETRRWDWRFEAERCDDLLAGGGRGRRTGSRSPQMGGDRYEGSCLIIDCAKS